MPASDDDVPLLGEIESPRFVPCAVCAYDRPYLVDALAVRPPLPWWRALFRRERLSGERCCERCGAR